jgi:cation diffusion facilitator family transporter
LRVPLGEKQSAALNSVIAAVALTVFKLLVGLSTNSLGILAEAAHSGLDLVAAVVTLAAVSVSARPPDSDHHYGHGKVENLSALFETSLLLITCAWIVYESIQRLLFKTVQIDVSAWAFIVMIASIVVDYSRSRNLSKAAKKYGSQALEADALHFSTDIWSSTVVIIGLTIVRLGESRPELQQITKADSFAALMVAGIVIYVSIRLGRKTVHGILDRAPHGLREKIKQSVESLPGVYDCHEIRVRTSGEKLFVDMHVLLDSKQTLEDAHRVTEDIEVAVKRLVPEADITVHAEPSKQQ